MWPRTAKSCGPDAPTLVSSRREATFAGDGGKKARSPGRARYKPLKPLRREGRDESGGPVVTTLVCLFHFRTRGCGCNGHPAFPAPSVSGRAVIHPLGRYSRCGKTEVCLLPRPVPGCHAPRRRGSQYAVASRISTSRLWNTGSPGQALPYSHILRRRWVARLSEL